MNTYTYAYIFILVGALGVLGSFITYYVLHLKQGGENQRELLSFLCRFRTDFYYDSPAEIKRDMEQTLLRHKRFSTESDALEKRTASCKHERIYPQADGVVLWRCQQCEETLTAEDMVDLEGFYIKD